MPKHKTPCIAVQQGAKTLLLTKLPAGVLTQISYVAVRRVDQEEGAVQRTLNENRIDKIARFALNGGDFPACIILNWQEKLAVTGAQIEFTPAERLAQVIDGQHRVEGLREAIKKEAKLQNLEIPVAIYQSLTTTECADIFLSINTEQRPVDKTLVYDLFHEASAHVVDRAILRATDIVHRLNKDEDSPYRGLVKLPGLPRIAFGIPLSTMASALKPLVEDGGVFEVNGVKELERQTRTTINMFSVLQDWYGDKWVDRDNVFMHAAGFTGAANFLKAKLVPYCYARRSYAKKTMKDSLRLSKSETLLRSSLKNMQGRASARSVTDYLSSHLSSEGDTDIEF